MKRVFYGWWMVGAGCGMQFVQSTLLLQSFGAYFAVLRDDRGWSKTELSGAAAMHQVEAAILGPLLGWFIDRFGPQWVIRTGVIVVAVCLPLSFVIRRRPEDMGEVMDGRGSVSRNSILAEKHGENESTRDFTALALLAGLGSIFFLLAKRPARPVL